MSKYRVTSIDSQIIISSSSVKSKEHYPCTSCRAESASPYCSNIIRQLFSGKEENLLCQKMAGAKK